MVRRAGVYAGVFFFPRLAPAPPPTRITLRRPAGRLYPDGMVRASVEPREAELREVHRSTANPFRGQRFDDVVSALRSWYVAERLEAALGAFYQNARGRVHIVVLPP